MIGEVSTLVYTVFAGLLLFGGILAYMVKQGRESEKNAQDIKFAHDQIGYLKEKFKKQDEFNNEIQKNQAENNKDLIKEIKQYENKIGEMYELLIKLNATMELIVGGKISTSNHKHD
ncbi:MAG TPA: hypothetical protein DEP37_03120 [Algoriphagus sp.]|nr:hypothetical protein [Algoriphagus sp.]